MTGPPVSGQPAYPGDGGYGSPPPGGGFVPPKKRSPLPFVLGGVGLLVVVVIVIAVVVFATKSKSGSHGATGRSPSAAASKSPSPTSSTPAGDGVQGDKIVDKATGWYFKKAGSPWQNTVHPAAAEIENPVGQTVMLGSHSSAVIEVGELNSQFGYTGPDDLEKVKSAVATSILKNYYGPDGAKVDPSQRHIDERLTQYSRKSWLWAFEVTYTSSAGKQTGEYVVIAVMDAGNGKAAAIWGSVPDGHDDLKADVNKAIGSVNY
jgi:hypothetical protein